MQATGKVMMVLAWLALAGQAQAQATPFRIQVPAQYEAKAPVVEQLRKECAIDSLLGNQVLSKVSRRYAEAVPTADPAQLNQGRALKLTILSVEGEGGAWSGSKAISMRADLLRDGQVVSSIVRREHSIGGMLGGLRGTCAILDIVAESLGQQVTTWLANLDAAQPQSPSLIQSQPSQTAPVAAPSAAPTEAQTEAVGTQSITATPLETPLQTPSNTQQSGTPAQSAP